MFRLIVITVDGSKKEYHYEDFDELEYNATFFQFSPNVARAYEQEWFFSGWKTLFAIGNDMNYIKKNFVSYIEEQTKALNN